jgi:hypothetical protein
MKVISFLEIEEAISFGAFGFILLSIQVDSKLSLAVINVAPFQS